MIKFNVLSEKMLENDSDIELQIDHILPISKGGTNAIDNLKTICKDCNIGKFNK